MTRTRFDHENMPGGTVWARPESGHGPGRPVPLKTIALTSAQLQRGKPAQTSTGAIMQGPTVQDDFLPAGGATHDILLKNSGDDFDASWGRLFIPPTSDPHVVGAIWNNLGTLTISAG